MSLPRLDEVLEESLFHVHGIRSKIQSTHAAGEVVDSETHAEFEAALAQAIYEIRPHVVAGNHDELRKLWDKYNVEYVTDFESRTVVEQSDAKCDNDFGIVKKDEKRYTRRVDIQSLLAVSRLLDRISNELGLMTETSQPRRPGGRFS